MWTWLKGIGRQLGYNFAATGRGKSARERARGRRQRPQVERLEDRVVPAIVPVSLTYPTMLSDTAAGSVTGPGSVSADGRYLVYTNSAANLAPGQVMDSKSAYDVFLYDRGTGVTTLVSHAAGLATTTADGTSKNAAISADGKWIAYVSNSDNLVSGETLSNDSYILSLGASGGTFTLTYGGQTTGPIAYNATAATIQTALTGLSGVGTGNATVTGFSPGPFTITFTGALANGKSTPLTADDTALTYSGGFSNFRLMGGHNEFLCDQYWVFLYNVQTGTNTLVSHAAPDQGSGFATMTADNSSGDLAFQGTDGSRGNILNTQAQSVSISQHGEFITYVSESTHLVNGQQPGTFQANNPPGTRAGVFVYDRAADTNILLTHSAASNAFTSSRGYSYGAVISADGSTIAFVAEGGDLFSGELANNDGGIFGPDDFEEVFYARAGAAGSWGNVTTGSNATIGLVSHVVGNPNRQASSASSSLGIYNILPTPAISPDGKWIAYTSFHDDLIRLVAGGGYGVQVDNVYLYDNSGDANNTHNFLLSHQYGNATQAGNNNLSLDTALSLPLMTPSLSDDGRYVTFLSSATNLSSSTSAAGDNVYLYDRLAADSNHNVTRITHTSIPAASIPLYLANGGTFSANPLAPTISGDGRYIGYVGFASGDISGLTNLNSASAGLAGTMGMDALLFDQGSSTYTLLSHDFASPTKTGTGEAYAPLISHDGSTVLYLDDSNNLLPTTVSGHAAQDLNAARPAEGTDLYAYSLNTPTGYTPVNGNAQTATAPVGTNATVTLSDPSLPTLTGNGESEISPVHALSSDGNFVVFTSNAPNLVPNEVDNSLTLNVYLYDASKAGTPQATTLLSHAATSATTTANGESTNAVISGDGKTVLFYSFATNLLGSGTPSGDVQLYLYDNNPGSPTYQQLTLISHTPGSPTQGANGTLPGTSGVSSLLYSTVSPLTGQVNGLALPSISDNGQYIAYLSNATNLVSATSGSKVNVFLYDNNPGDSQYGKNTLVSSGISSGNPVAANGNASTVAISGDGTIVAFTDAASNLLPTSISNNKQDELYVWNRTANVLKLASHGASDTNNGPPTAATITKTSPEGPLPASLDYSGNIITYYMGATNLVTGQTGGVSAYNVFVYVDNNLNSSNIGTNFLLSHVAGSLTQAGDNPTNPNQFEASGPAISSDGRYVVYANNSTNLLGTALIGQNGQDNVYLYDATTQANILVSHADGSTTAADANGGTSASISADGRYVTFIDLALNNTADVDCTFTPSANVRLYDSQASATAEPTIVGGAFDPTPMILVGATLAPAEVVVTSTGPVVSWVGLASEIVPGKRNTNLDVFLQVPANSNPVPPTSITLVPTSSVPPSTITPIGTIIDTVVATPTNQTYTYVFAPPITGTNDNSKFSLTTTGVLTTNTSFNVTTATNYTITVTATVTNTNLSLTQNLTITVYPEITDITLTPAVPPPTTISPANTPVGTLVTTDPNPNPTFIYVPTGPNANLVTVVDGNLVLTNPITTPGTYPVDITVTDNLGLTITKTVDVVIYQPITTITLTPAVPPPTTISPANTPVGTLVTTDPNNSPPYSYVPTGPNANLVTVVDGNLVLTNPITTPGTYPVDITVTDNLGLTITKTIDVVIYQPITTLNYTLTVPPATTVSPVGTPVATLTAVDPNPNPTFTYSLTSPPDGQLTVDKTGVITTNEPNLPAGPITVTAVVTDNLGLTQQATFTVTIAKPITSLDYILSVPPATTDSLVGTPVATLTPVDPNPNPSFTYTLISPTDGQLTVDKTGVVTTNELNLPAESITVTAQVTDNLGLTAQTTFTVTIYQPITTIDVTLTKPPLTTTSPPNTIVGTLVATDPNPGQTPIFTVPPDSPFKVVDGNLVLVTPIATAGPVTVNVTVTDQVGVTVTKPITITIYQPIQDITLSNTTIKAAQSVNTPVGTFTSTDPNNNQTFTYTLTGTQNDNANFIISGNTLQTNTVFAVGTATNYTVDVQVVDAPLGLSFDKTFTITVNPAPPTDISLSNQTIKAAQPVGTTVGTLSTTDPNANQAETYTLTGTNAGLFSVSGSTLLTNTVFAVGAPTDFTVGVHVVDTLGLSFDKTFTITVNPAPPTDITLSNDTVAATQPVATVVGLLSTTDPNASQSFTYAVLTNTSLFAISGNSLVTNAIFSVGVPTQYTTQVQTTDSLGLTFSKTFTVTVFPSGPTDITLSNQTIMAAQPVKTAVGTLGATDPNFNQAFTFTLAGSGNDNSLFAINGSTLQTNTVFAVGTATNYTIGVHVVDTLGLTFDKSFIITVNPAPPTDISLSNTTIKAAQPVATTVGTLSTTDPNANQAETYTLTGTNAGLFSVSGSTLLTNTVFAVGTATNYTVGVHVVDTLGLSFDKSFTITVNPAPPTDISLSNTTIKAAQPVATTVGTLSTTDPNANQTETYTLTGANAGLFSVSGSTLLTNTVFAVGTATNYTVGVHVVDAPLGLSFDKTFTITVIPAPPIDIALSNTAIKAAQPVATTVGTLSTTDPNANQAETYTLTGTNAGLFSVSGSTLATNTVFAVGTATNYTVGVHVVDTLGLSFDKTFTITVSPAPPTDIALSNATITAAQPVATTVGTLSTTDPNAGQNFIYTLLTNTDLFAINGSDLVTNTIFSVGAPIQYTTLVQTADSLGLTLTKTFTITVNPAALTDIALSNTAIKAAQPVATTVGTLSTTDPNANQAETYTLTGTNAGLFSVSGSTLLTNTVFAVGTATNYTVGVHVVDTPLGLSFDKTFTITVSPAPPTDIALSNTTVAAAQPSGTAVGKLSTTDPNANQKFTYTLLSNTDLFAISGDALVTQTAFSVAKPTPYTAQVQTTDSLGLTFTKTLTVTVNPAPPTDINLTNSTVQAGEPAGTIIGTLTATDPNPNQTITYTLVDNTALFIIVGNTLETNKVLSVGVTTTYDVQVQATDTLGLNLVETIPITVKPPPPPSTDVVYVNGGWADLPTGIDPDGPNGPADVFGPGGNAFATIQDAENAVDPGGTIIIIGGTYSGPIDITKPATVELDGDVTINSLGGDVVIGAAVTALTAGGESLTINAGGGNVTFIKPVGVTPLDNLTINGASNVTFDGTVNLTGNLTETGGSGTTTFNGGTIGGSLAVTAANITLASGTLIVNTATLDASSAVVIPAGTALQAKGPVVLDGGFNNPAGGSVTLDGTVTGSKVTLLGGPGNDTFTVQKIASPTTVDGLGGTNQLNVDLGTVSAAQTVYVTSLGVSSSALGAPLSYQDTGGTFGKGLNVTTGAGNDTVVVQSTAAGTPTVVNTGAGNDTVYVASTTNLAASVISGLAGPLSIDAGAGANALTISDAGSAGTNAYFVTGAAIGPSDSPNAIWFKATGGNFNGGVTVVGGQGNNTYVVLSTFPRAPTTAYGQSGNDTFDTGVSTASSYGNLTLNGGGGSNTLGVYDQSGSAVVNAAPSGAGTGQVKVSYLSAPSSTVTYQNMGNVGSNVDPDTSFIQALFQADLGSNAAPNQLSFWLGVLHGPGGRAAVVDGIVHSQPALTRLVAGWYHQYLNRAPVGGEEQALVQQLIDGQTEETVLASLIASDEFAGLNQPLSRDPNVNFVQRAFPLLLGRAATPAEVGAYVNTLIPQVGRTGAAWLILTSADHRRQAVIQDYQQLLPNLHPAQSDIDYWALGSLDLLSIYEQFELSPAFPSARP